MPPVAGDEAAQIRVILPSFLAFALRVVNAIFGFKGFFLYSSFWRKLTQ